VESGTDELGTKASIVELHYLRAPGAGRLQVIVDGAVRANLSTASNRVEAAFWTTEVEDGRHRVELVARGGGPVKVLGLSMTRPAGVVYDALGVNGARFVHWQRADEALVTAELGRDPPALVVTTFGTNETDEDEATGEAHRRAFLRTLGMLRRAAPGASCLVVGPPDRATKAVVRRRRVWQTTAALAPIITAERQAALESGCAFWNTFAAMGGSGTMRRWAVLDPPLAGDDRVHLTSSGYRLLADALASALLGSQ
jgi:lysophospholipase L1-like esterase